MQLEVTNDPHEPVGVPKLAKVTALTTVDAGQVTTAAPPSAALPHATVRKKPVRKQL